MSIQLPPLPYARSALAPHMSEETLDYHYGKHHKTYVEKANKLIEGTEFANAAAEDIIRKASGPIYNNVAQAWNHSFFWNCLAPNSSSPNDRLGDALAGSFGSIEEFQSQFGKTATEQFGSGWAWLVKDGQGALKILGTGNADNPLRSGQTPLLTCDVWEHAYYIDCRNDRAAYLKHFWALVNWRFVEENLR